MSKIKTLFLSIVITVLALQLNSCGGSSDIVYFLRTICGGFYLNAGTYGFVGAGGSSLVTTNSGSSFLSQETPVTEDLTDYTIKGGIHYAIGKNSTYLTRLSIDADYQFRDLGIRADYNDIEFADEEVGYIAASGGTILSTWDRGTTWEGTWLDNTTNLYSVSCFDRNTCWTVGSGGNIYKTNDGFSNTTLQASLNLNLHEVLAINASTAYVVGDGGYLGKTTDGGSNWQQLASGTTNDLYGIAFDSTLTRGLTYGDHYAAYSEDSGATWNPSTFDINIDEFINEVFAFKFFLSFSNLIGALTGNTNGWLFHTNDFGKTFTSQRIELSITANTANEGSGSGSEEGSGSGSEDFEEVDFITMPGGTTDEGSGSGSDEGTGSGSEESTETGGSTEGDVLEFTISDQDFSFSHQVGTTQCPQKIGEFVVTNTGTVQTSYVVDISSLSGSISSTPVSFSLAPGETRTVELFFTCNKGTSFSGTFTVSGSAGGSTTAISGTINGNVG